MRHGDNPSFLCVASLGLFNGFLLNTIAIHFLTYATDVVDLMAEKLFRFSLFVVDNL